MGGIDFMIAFFNSFLTYLMLMLVIVVVAGAAIFAGITMRKKKNLTESGEDTGAGQADGE